MSSSLGHTYGQRTVIAGATRSQDVGQVVLMQEQKIGNKKYLVPSTRETYLTGDQLGSMFGHATAPVDLNGDEYVKN